MVGIADGLPRDAHLSSTNRISKERIKERIAASGANPTAMTGWINGDFNHDGVISLLLGIGSKPGLRFSCCLTNCDLPD